MASKTPDEDCGGKRECREDRFAKNLQENEDAKKESQKVLRTVADTLEEAARTLRDYGDAPFKDLER